MTNLLLAILPTALGTCCAYLAGGVTGPVQWFVLSAAAIGLLTGVYLFTKGVIDLWFELHG